MKLVNLGLSSSSSSPSLVLWPFSHIVRITFLWWWSFSGCGFRSAGQEKPNQINLPYYTQHSEWDSNNNNNCEQAGRPSRRPFTVHLPPPPIEFARICWGDTFSIVGHRWIDFQWPPCPCIEQMTKKIAHFVGGCLDVGTDVRENCTL